MREFLLTAGGLSLVPIVKPVPRKQHEQGKQHEQSDPESEAVPNDLDLSGLRIRSVIKIYYLAHLDAEPTAAKTRAPVQADCLAVPTGLAARHLARVLAIARRFPRFALDPDEAESLSSGWRVLKDMALVMRAHHLNCASLFWASRYTVPRLDAEHAGAWRPSWYLSPAYHRNRRPLYLVLRRLLPRDLAQIVYCLTCEAEGRDLLARPWPEASRGNVWTRARDLWRRLVRSLKN